MPWKATDAMKEKVNLVMEWERRWHDAQGGPVDMANSAASRGEPTDRLHLGEALPRCEPRRASDRGEIATAALESAGHLSGGRGLDRSGSKGDAEAWPARSSSTVI